jgi:hypothetical protein
MAYARGLLGGVGETKASKGRGKRPALLAVAAGLGAAGALVLKRRRTGEDPAPEHIPAPQAVGEPRPRADAAPPSGAA